MKKRKVHIITKIVAITLIAIAVVAFALNWFMANRLEKYLRSYLTENVSDLTNGFYHFTFDSLSIGLFDGELSIKGVEMYPDSAILAHLKEKDSLPDLYFNIKIAAIDLKGINLVWRLNYRNLGFKIFEIKSPNIQITQKEAETKSKDELIPENTPKDLYDIISPYFDQISVKTMNLENATITYNVDKDDNTTATYGLRDANLHTYNFILNKNSNIDSRFLYCDDIIFEVDKHQTIIDDNNFKVETDHLEFSTRDSLILIKGVKLTPHDTFWEQRLSVPGNYIEAGVNLVEIRGMSLTHKNHKTELLADSFKISNSHINCFTVDRDDKPNTVNVQNINANEKTNPWTLYDVVSPVLSKVAIEKVAFEEVVLEYNMVKNGQTDNFKLQNFNFHADQFLLDSLSAQRQQFWHCQDYILSASEIKGRVNSKNYGVTLSHMLLDTEKGAFHLKGIQLSKLDSLHNESRNYVIGSISSIDFIGLDLEKGLSASNFTIQNPQIELYIVEDDDNEGNHDIHMDKKAKQRDDNIWNLFVPYADYLSVKNININNANVTYHNLIKNENFALKRFYFYAKDFLVNDKTRQQPDLFYTCSDFGFQFSNFDNLLPGKNYRLQIRQAELSHIKKELLLNNVVLTPQEKTWEKAPETYFSLSTPLIKVEATTSVFDNNLVIDSLDLKSIKIDSPQLAIVKTTEGYEKGEDSEKEPDKDFLSFGFLRRLSIGIVEVNNANVNYKDVSSNSFDISLNKINIDSLKLWSKQSVSLGELSLSDTRMNVKHDSRHSYISMPTFNLQKFRYGTSDNPMAMLSALSLNIPSPTINIDVVEKGGKRKEQKPKDSKPKDKSKLLADITSKIKTNIAIDEFSIPDAKISFAENGVPSKNEIGATSFRMDGLKFDAQNNALRLEDLYLSASNLRIPVSKGFYTLIVDKVSADSKLKQIEVDKIHLLAKYPKEDFARKHPKGKDWFDVKVRNVTLSGLDIPQYLSSNQVYASYLGVHDVTLDNYKNQKVEIQHNKMPLIYTAIQKAPIKFSIDSLDVTNFSVDYQELPTKGDMAGTILFQGMNGRLKDFTNIATEPKQLMNLHADGVFMNSGKFDAVWKIPVSKDYDRFFLDAHLYQFSLPDLNQILIPLGSAEVNSGLVSNVWITMDATSEGASSTMLLLYNDLSVSLYKDPNLERPYKFVNKLIPLLIKKNNPNKPGKKPRRAEATIVRDKYHSTFNYFWQILQPPLIQSVGVSEKRQRAGKKIAFFMSEVKNFFRPNSKKKKPKEEVNDDEEHSPH